MRRRVFGLLLLAAAANGASVVPAYRSVTGLTVGGASVESRLTRSGQDYLAEDANRVSRFRAQAESGQYLNEFGDRLVVGNHGTAQRYWGDAGETQRGKTAYACWNRRLFTGRSGRSFWALSVYRRARKLDGISR